MAVAGCVGGTMGLAGWAVNDPLNVLGPERDEFAHAPDPATSGIATAAGAVVGAVGGVQLASKLGTNAFKGGAVGAALLGSAGLVASLLHTSGEYTVYNGMFGI